MLGQKESSQSEILAQMRKAKVSLAKVCMAKKRLAQMVMAQLRLAKVRFWPKRIGQSVHGPDMPWPK